MRIDLVSARHSPVRLVKDGRELRQLHSPFDMFGNTSGSISLDAVSSVTVVAPYNQPSRTIVWFLFGMASGLLAISLGINVTLLRMAACLPLAFAIVLAIIPPGSSSTRVLVRIVSAARPHMLAMAREELSTFRQEVPDAEWKDEEDGMGAKPLNPRERLRLKLMQIGLVMSMTSISSVAMIYLQQHPGMIPENDVSSDYLVWFLRAAEVVALVLFVACWITLVRTGMRARQAMMPTESPSAAGERSGNGSGSV